MVYTCTLQTFNYLVLVGVVVAVVKSVLRRCPDDKHAADEFCEEILGSVQGELEDLLNDELKKTVENGFVQLEKLILQSNNLTPDSLVRKVEKFPKPAPKKVRRNS